MENMKETLGKTQGVEPKKQKASASYTIRALGENVRKLTDLGLMTNEESKTISEIHKKIGQKYIKEQLGL